ncbi:hypothetical protein Tsubulata_008042 [Turnera subulata]|uniref:Uncharacterized protein n=1 Tax=Turnera subulata TaxID=218843 RepID=A0A9Q0J4Q5_9ROSI|nr:hypothetical protein Tsubulata_008042 [Turnera subulata]
MYWEYHQSKGHDTDDCFCLRHMIQDLIDQGKLIPPTKPSTKTNPLPSHNTISAIF